MPRSQARKNVNTFVGGLNTEASPLSYPENTAKSIDNVDLNRDGSIHRRLGLEYETSYVLSSEIISAAEAEEYAITVHEWESAGGDDSLNFLVIQNGHDLHFHRLGEDTLSASYLDTISIHSLGPTGGHIDHQAPIVSAVGKGRLFIVGKGMTPAYIEYNKDTAEFSVNPINIQVRDIDGIDEPGVDVEYRPNTLSNTHKYNLRNQGWPIEIYCLQDHKGNENPVLKEPIQYTRDIIGVYPSNADILFYSRAQSVERANCLNAYSPWDLDKTMFGNTPAAKGHYILDAFDRNRQAASGITGTYLPSRDKTDNRPTSVEFYAGRVWYLMPDGKVYYSQVLTDISRAGKCYQEADPTAEDINELVATDGGELDISGISRAMKLVAVGNQLVILAENGVWSISGSGDESFSAVSQEIRKVTNVGALGCFCADAAVEAENTLFYWSPGGIYVLTPDQVTGFLSAQDITRSTILTHYLDIHPVARQRARGFYDEESKKIFWLYNDDDDFDGASWRYRFNKALILDLTLQAFYTYSIETSSDLPFIAAMVQKSANNLETTTEDVTDSGVVVTNSGVDVTITLSTPVTAEVKLKLLTLVPRDDGDFNYTFSEFKSLGFKDWVIETGGQDYLSYIETGWDLAGDMIAEKESNTIYTFFSRTETATVFNDEGGLAFDYPSSCKLRAKWQWADSETYGRWSEEQQVYRLNRHWIPTGIGPFDYGTEVIQTINQVRGKGQSLSLRFSSETGKDFRLLGWAIPYTAMTAA